MALLKQVSDDISDPIGRQFLLKHSNVMKHLRILLLFAKLSLEANILFYNTIFSTCPDRKTDIQQTNKQIF